MNEQHLTKPHNKIINRLARTHLKPLGLTQKGRSRMWMDDQGWYLILYEFQPSSYSKGTYINLGICFNNYPNDFFSFDIGGRIAEFTPAKDLNNFENELTLQIQNSIQLINKYQEFTFDKNLGELVKQSINDQNKDTDWTNYHIGFAYLLQGKSKFTEYLTKVVNSSDDRSWAIERANHTKALMAINETDQLAELINKCRELRKLSTLSQSELMK